LPGAPPVESVTRPAWRTSTHFRRIGDRLGADARASGRPARRGIRRDRREIARRRPAAPPRRVLLLEWFDPPLCLGPLEPELIALAGGLEAIGRPGERSRRLSWEESRRPIPS